tara:strand:+ start:2581 stop:3894 length:1314 start_codon:yes stop_codon:yes gene_type:complete
MGKQILLDAGRVWLPERDVTLSFPLVFGETLSRTLHFEPREVQFVSAVSEKKLENGLTPDVTALLKNDAQLHIEILVTHAVEEEKGLAVDNVMEIDLSRLSEETVLDSSALELEVLKSAWRWWHRCSLIDELPKVQAVREELEARVPREIKRLERNREREEAAERQKERKSQLTKKRREAQAKKREAERKPWLATLKKLEHAEDFMGWLDMANKMSERAKPHLEPIAQRLGFDAEKWPTALNIPINQEWVFKEDRRLWQSAVFEKLIFANKRGAVISVGQALEVAENAVGVRVWALQLIQLKQAHVKQSYNQRRGYQFRGVWFFEPNENRAIRSAYAVVFSYLKRLCKRGVLAEVRSAKTFRILLTGSDAWKSHCRHQQIPSADRAIKSAGTLNGLVNKVSQESLKMEAARKQRRKDNIERLELSVIDAREPVNKSV